MAHMGYVGFRFEIWELSKIEAPVLYVGQYRGLHLEPPIQGNPDLRFRALWLGAWGLTAFVLSNPSSHRLSSTKIRDFRCNCTIASRRNN